MTQPARRPQWFADVDQETHGMWQPCLETFEGHIPCFEVWFDTEQQCRDWITKYVIGATLEPDSDRYSASR